MFTNEISGLIWMPKLFPYVFCSSVKDSELKIAISAYFKIWGGMDANILAYNRISLFEVTFSKGVRTHNLIRRDSSSNPWLMNILLRIANGFILANDSNCGLSNWSN